MANKIVKRRDGGKAARESFAKFGKERHSDAQVLESATGIRWDDVDLDFLREATIHQLVHKGLDPDDAARLHAAAELAKRMFPPTVTGRTTVGDPYELADEFRKLIGWQQKEVFMVAALDIRHQVLDKQILSVGSATEVTFDGPGLYKFVLLSGATRFAVAHNHPSGSLEPSSSDLELTEALAKGGACLGVALLDHIIIHRERHLSLRSSHEYLFEKLE